jgi:hypothetical protein
MRKELSIAAITTVGLIELAHAQPSANEPSGTGPEGTSKGSAAGSGMTPAWLQQGAPGSDTSHSTKRSKKKKASHFVIVDIAIR